MKNNNSENISLIPAVAYARFSSANQNEASIEQQLRDIRKWAENNGFCIIHEYTDAARSAFKEATEAQRPQFRKMIEDSKTKSFKAVIVWKTDRFARNLYDAAIAKHELEKNDVRVFKVMESNIEGSQAVVVDTLMLALAQQYSENLSENVKRGMNDSAMKFKAMGRLPLGYVKDPNTGRYAIDETEAQLVRRIFRDYSSGKPAAKITKELNEEGHKTKNGTVFNKSSIRKIIANERYIGTYIFNGNKTENAIPAIIDRNTFNAAQEKLEIHHHKPAIKTETGFLLAGRLICGECGATMPGDSAKSKSGKIHYWYTCRNKRFSHSCDNPRAIRDDLEDRVVNALLDFLNTDGIIEQAADQILESQARQSPETTASAIEGNISAAKKKLDNILKAIENGAALDSLLKRAVDLEQEIKDLTLRLNQERLSNPALTKDQIIFLFDKIRKADMENEKAKQHLIDALLEKAILYKDGKLVLILNTGKNNKRDQLTIENVNAAIELENPEIIDSGDPEAEGKRCSNFEPLPQPIGAKFEHVSNLIGTFVIDGYFGMIFAPSSLG